MPGSKRDNEVAISIADPPAVTIRPPFGERAKAAMARSIWGASRMLTGLTSIRSDGATAWIMQIGWRH